MSVVTDGRCTKVRGEVPTNPDSFPKLLLHQEHLSPRETVKSPQNLQHNRAFYIPSCKGGSPLPWESCGMKLIGRWELVSVLSQEMGSSAETHFALLLPSAYPVNMQNRNSVIFLFERQEVLESISSFVGTHLPP